MPTKILFYKVLRVTYLHTTLVILPFNDLNQDFVLKNLREKFSSKSI